MKNSLIIVLAFVVSMICGCATVPERDASFVSNKPAKVESDLIFSHAGRCLARSDTGWKDGIRVQRLHAYGVSIIEVISYATDGESEPWIRMEFRDIDKGSHIMVEQPEGIGSLTSSYEKEDDVIWNEAKDWAKGKMVCRRID